MNKVSKICNLIQNNQETWKKELESLRVRVKENLPLAIFNYDLEADFTNPIVREARGIIINLENLDVVCWPFTKFCNLHEEGAKLDLEEFDWDSCRCLEKVDGSIMKLWFNNLEGNWQWSTNSCISAKTAMSLGGIYDFEALIKSAINYRKINFDSLDKDLTYIFELVSPENKIVVQYKNTELYHIGTRNNITGKELELDIGIRKPKDYKLNSLQDCIYASQKLNNPEGEVTNEGFVIVDKYYHRAKIKSPEYLIKHRLVDVGKLSKLNILSSLRSGISTIEDLIELAPYRKVQFKYYDYKMAELEYNIQRYVYYVKGLYEELGRDRKALANAIKNDKYKAFGFEAITCEGYDVSKRLKELSNFRYAKLIDDYEIMQF